MKCIRLHHSKRWLLPVELAVTVIILQESCPSLHCDAPHVHSDLPTPPTFPPLTVKAERTPRSERKRRDSFGMYDGYESCSEESTSSSSSEDSDDEVVPSIPASLPIIKNNGQVYTYPDGKAGMGERLNGNLQLPLSLPFSFLFFSVNVSERSSPSVRLTLSRCCLSFPPQRRARCVEWWACAMLFTPKRSASAACRVRGAIPPIPKRPASWRDYRWGLPLLPLWCISLTMTSWLILTRFSGAFSGQTTNEKSKSFAETASNGKAGCLRPVPSKSTEPVQIKSWYAFTLQ